MELGDVQGTKGEVPGRGLQGTLSTDPWWLRKAFAAMSAISSLLGPRLGEVRANKADEGTARRSLSWAS